MGKVRGAKVKTIKKSNVSDDELKDLHKMFEQITGTSNAERNVLIPKINKIYKIIVEYNKLFNILLEFKPLTEQFENHSVWFEDIANFLKDLVASTEVNLDIRYEEDTSSKYHSMNDEELNAFYKSLKDKAELKKIIITGGNLATHKSHLMGDKPDDNFIKREPGVSMQPFAFSSFDIKLIWSHEDTNDKLKMFILSFLKKTYTKGIELYDVITSPDVDIKKFSGLLINSISKMKKQIPRCDKAFSIIEKSVHLLEDNFKSYFRTSVEAGNPNIIIESFMVDLTTSHKSNAVISGEFGRIINFLKEKGMQNADPRVKKLFGMLNGQFAPANNI